MAHDDAALGIAIDEYHRIPPFNDLSQYPSPRALTPISCTNRCGTWSVLA